MRWRQKFILAEHSVATTKLTFAARTWPQAKVFHEQGEAALDLFNRGLKLVANPKVQGIGAIALT